jgi:hypothetical protein
MDYFPRKSLSKYLTDMIDFNKHMHDIEIFINDKWRKYAKNQLVFRRKHVKLNFDKTFGVVAV